MVEKVFALPYWISNNGDGSASIQLEKSPQRAERKDDLQNENEGWGEPSYDTIILVLKDGVLYYKEYGKTVRVPLIGEDIEDDISNLKSQWDDEDE